MGTWEKGRRALFAWVSMSAVFTSDRHVLTRLHGVPSLGPRQSQDHLSLQGDMGTREEPY